MKILHLIESGGLYGAESVILNLSRELQSHHDDITPIVGCIVSSAEEHSDLYNKACEYGIPAQKIILRNGWLPIDIPRAVRQFKQSGFSIIHSHGYKPSVFGFIIHMLSGIPIMATCHLWFLQGKVPLKMRIMVSLELFFYRFFPVVVAVSEPIRQILVSNGVAADKLIVIKNGIVIQDYRSKDKNKLQELRNELGLHENEICVVNIARLSRQKAQWHIITAARKIVELGFNAKFFIVGEGPLREELAYLINKNGVEECVQLLGFRCDTKDLLHVADIFLLPSLDEGMPMALLEAAAAKTAIIATPVGDIPKFLRTGETGFLVQVDDEEELVQGLITVLESSELREKLSHRAFAELQQSYSSTVMCDQYVKTYRTILS